MCWFPFEQNWKKFGSRVISSRPAVDQMPGIEGGIILIRVWHRNGQIGVNSNSYPKSLMRLTCVSLAFVATCSPHTILM